MKIKFGRRALSVFLSVLMVVTMLPTFAITSSAKTDWTLINSTDFTGTTWSYTTNKNSYNYTDATGFTSVDGGNSDYTTWSGIEYWQNEKDYMPDGWNKFYTDPAGASGRGTMVRDGFMYLNGWYDEGTKQATDTTPITGLSSFKIDLEFQFWNDFSLRNNQDDKNAYCFIKLKTYTTVKTTNKFSV